MTSAEVSAAIVLASEEELTIASTVVLALQYADEVFVIDNGSRDRTGDVAAVVGAKVVRLDKRIDPAKAFLAGLAEAVKLDPDCTVLIDGAGGFDPDDIPKLSAPVLHEGADLVIGSRFLRKASSSKERSRPEAPPTNAEGRAMIMDRESGFRALSRRALQSTDLDPSHNGVGSDMIANLEARNLRIIEVPVSGRKGAAAERKEAPSAASFSGGIISSIGLRHPLYLFSVPGLVLALLGLTLGLVTVLQTTLFNWTPMAQGAVGLMCFATGLILGLGGFLLNALGLLIAQGGQAPLQSKLRTSASVLGKVQRALDKMVRFLALRHGLLFFGLAGIVISAVGLGFMLMAWNAQIIFFAWAALTQGLFGSFLLLVGVLIFTAGIILNSLHRLLPEQ